MVDMENMSIFDLIFDKEFIDFMVYWKIQRCLSCLVIWEIDRKSFLTRIKLKTLQTLWKLDYLTFFFFF